MYCTIVSKTSVSKSQTSFDIQTVPNSKEAGKETSPRTQGPTEATKSKVLLDRLAMSLIQTPSHFPQREQSGLPNGAKMSISAPFREPISAFEAPAAWFLQPAMRTKANAKEE